LFSKTTIARSRWFDRLIPEDDEKTKAFKQREREVILEGMRRSKFAQINAAATEKSPNTDGSLAHISVSSVFPSCELTPLVDGAGSAALPPLFSSHASGTVVTLSFQALGQAQARKWHELLLSSRTSSDPSVATATRQVALLDVLYLEGWMFSALRGVFTSSARRAAPPNVLNCSAIAFEPSAQKADHFCAQLGVRNRLMAHVFLVDVGGRVRWTANAEPTGGEPEAFLEAVQQLARESRSRL
jgi:hypothetical protein